MTLEDSIGRLEAAITGYSSKMDRFARRFDRLENDMTKSIATNMTKLIATGKEQVFTGNTLAKEFRNTGLSLKESLGLLRTSIVTGFRQYDGASKKLLTSVVKLGLSERLFSDMLAFNSEVLGINNRENVKLGDHIVSLGRRFNIDSNALVAQLRSLDDTTRRYALQYGGGAAANLQRVVTTLGAALGPQYLGAVGELANLVTSTTVKDYVTAARFGGGGVGRGASSDKILDEFSKMSKSILDLSDRFGISNSPLSFQAQIFGKQLNVSKELLQLVRKLDETGGIKGSLGLEIAKQMDVTQMSYDVQRNITSVIASFQATMLPYALKFTKWLAENVGEINKFVDRTMVNIETLFNKWNVSGKFDGILDTASKGFRNILEWTQGQLPNITAKYVKPAFSWMIESGKSVISASKEMYNAFHGIGTSPFGEYMSGKISWWDMITGNTLEMQEEERLREKAIAAELRSRDSRYFNSAYKKLGYRVPFEHVKEPSPIPEFMNTGIRDTFQPPSPFNKFDPMTQTEMSYNTQALLDAREASEELAREMRRKTQLEAYSTRLSGMRSQAIPIQNNLISFTH